MKPYSFLFVLFGMMSLLFSCAGEEEIFDVGDTDGRIVLRMSEAGPFITVRAEQQSLTDFTGFTFTLQGTDSKGNTVNTTLELLKEENEYSCIVPAGTYTLTADNATAAIEGNGKPYYHGTSSKFDLKRGSTVDVSINLGSPKNAKISLNIASSFSDLYSLTALTLTDGEREVSLTASAEEAFFMVPSSGTITYTIKAKANPDSHVSDLPANGITQTLPIASGTHYPITLTAKAIADLLIAIGEGSHEGEFDAPAWPSIPNNE